MTIALKPPLLNSGLVSACPRDVNVELLMKGSSIVCENRVMDGYGLRIRMTPEGMVQVFNTMVCLILFCLGPFDIVCSRAYFVKMCRHCASFRSPLSRPAGLMFPHAIWRSLFYLKVSVIDVILRVGRDTRHCQVNHESGLTMGRELAYMSWITEIIIGNKAGSF